MPDELEELYLDCDFDDSNKINIYIFTLIWKGFFLFTHYHIILNLNNIKQILIGRCGDLLEVLDLFEVVINVCTARKSLREGHIVSTYRFLFIY